MSYAQALEVLAAAMGHGSFKSAKRGSRSGMVLRRDPVMHQLNNREFKDFCDWEKQTEYRAGEFTNTVVDVTDGESTTLSGRLRKFFLRMLG